MASLGSSTDRRRRQSGKITRGLRKPGQQTATKTPAPTRSMESLLKLAAAVAAAIYALGLVIVNLYLLRFGVAEFNLLRPRFIITGVLALVALTLPYVCIAVLAWLWRAMSQPKLAIWRRLYGITLSIPIALMCILAPFVVYTTPIFGLHALQALGLYAISVIVGVYIVVAVRWTKEIQKPGWRPTHPDADPWLGRTLALGSSRAGVVGFLLLYTFYFASVVYPHAPEPLGGSRPRDVRLVVKADSAAALRELAVPMSAPGGQLTEPIELIFQGQGFYLVRWSGHTATLNADSVIAVANA
jgi:hypothetical protein